MLPRPPRLTLFPYTTLFRSKLFLVIGLVGAFMTAAYMTRCVYLTFHGEYRGAHAPHAVPHVDEAEHDPRSEEHTSELQSPYDLVCRLLLEKKMPTSAKRTSG